MKNLLSVLSLFVALSVYSQNKDRLNAFTKSYALEKEKDYSGAIIALNTVYDSASYELSLRQGWLCYNAGFYPLASWYYSKAEAVCPGSEEALSAHRQVALALGNYDLQARLLKKILDINPMNTSASYSLGTLYYYEKNYNEAEKYFKRIIMLYPFNYDALLMLAWCKFQQGNKTEARDLFYKVVLYSPYDKSAKDGIAMMGMDFHNIEALTDSFAKSYSAASAGNYKAAINTLKSVYNKSSYEINLRLGYLSYLAGLNKEAMDYYIAASALAPGALEPLFGYIDPAMAFGQVNAVMDQYKKIVEIDPQNTSANYKIGNLLYDLKDYDSAKPHYQKVVSLYPFSYDGLHMLAKTELQLGNKAEAKKLYQRLLLLSPTDKEAKEALSALK